MIEQLQTTWAELTKQELHARATERLFYEFNDMGFTDSDLRCVLNYLLRFNRNNDGAKFRINAVKIVGDLENFASLLGEARAIERNRKPSSTPRDNVLQAFRPGIPDGQTTTHTARPFSDVLKAIKL